MPKIIPEKYLESLINAVEKFPNGATVRQILRIIDNPPPIRTLQFHLAKLVKDKRLESFRKGNRNYYQIISKYISTNEKTAQLDTIGLKLASIALEIKKKVTAPIFERKPVGYNRSFLDNYIPNLTYYLSASIREELKSMGTVSDCDLPAGTYLREVFNRLLIDLSWNSSRLEGNTYSLLETERLLDMGESADGKNAKEAQMILNHKGAIELLSYKSNEIGLDYYTICNIHALLSDNLLADPQACGRLRSRNVGITGTVFHPLAVPQMIEECFNIILDKATVINDPFEKAFFILVQMPYLQPFDDVNKRVSRIAANIPLVQMNLCPLSFVDVPINDFTGGVLGIYELNSIEYLRDVFVWAYKRSCERYSAVRQSLGEPDPIRIRYKTIIKSIVSHIVQQSITKKDAVTFIKERVGNINDKTDISRLIEVIETELLSLHEGNILRYHIQKAEFNTWKNNW